MFTKTGWVIDKSDPTIKRRIDYVIYETAEAVAAGISFKPWHECSSPGEWGETDDQYVTQLRRFKACPTPRGGITEIRDFTARDVVWEQGRTRPHFVALDSNRRPSKRDVARREKKIREKSRTQKKDETGVVTAATPKWLAAETRKERLKAAVHIAALYKIAGKKIDYEQVGRTYRPDDKNPALKAKFMFKYAEVRRLMDKDIAETLKINEIDPGFVLQSLKRIAEKAEAAEDFGNARLIYQDFVKMLDLYPKQQTQKLLPESTDGLDAQFTEITEGDMPPAKVEIPKLIVPPTKFEELTEEVSGRYKGIL